MRITGGNAARRILKVPKGLDVRPTPDLVKQAVFNSLGARVVGAKVLELFAGSGALSLECLSRGAASVMCVEKSHRHAEFIRSNADAAGYGEILEVRTQDVFPVMNQLAESGRQFDLILADPPYGGKKCESPFDFISRSNCSMIKICRSCSRTAEDLFLATRNATRWKSSRRGRK